MKNDNSELFKDWTINKLKQEAEDYYEMIYNLGCYSTRDLLIYDSILRELDKRGLETGSQLTFNQLTLNL